MDPIDAGSVVLRLLDEADIADVTVAANDPLVQRFVPHLPNPYTHADAREFVLVNAPAAWADGGAEFAVADRATGHLLGMVGVSRRSASVGEVGYWMAPWARRRGVATQAAQAISIWAFKHGYERLELRTELENGASQRVAIAAGFHREGIQRGGGQGRDGRRHDLLMWARLATDPPGPSPRLLPDLPGGQLRNGPVRLVPVRAEDSADVYRLRSLPEVVATSVPPEPVRPDAIARWCAQADANWLAGTRAVLMIRDAATDAHAGEIALYYSEPATGQAMIGYDVLPAWRGRGYASAAVRAVATWVFTHTGIARLIAGTAPDNTASRRVLEAAGFRREGYQRARLPGPSGVRVDDLLYALLPGEVTATPERRRGPLPAEPG